MIYKTNREKNFGCRLGGEHAHIYELAAMLGDSVVDNDMKSLKIDK